MQSRYKKLRAVLRSLMNGTSIVSACKAADIEPVTLWRWRKSKPGLDATIRNIIDSRIQIVEDALYKSATEGNTTSMIFFLTNRAPDRWADKRAVINNTNVFKAENNGISKLPESDLRGIINLSKRIDQTDSQAS